jgi:Tfp pilus assembly protein PilF
MQLKAKQELYRRTTTDIMNRHLSDVLEGLKRLASEAGMTGLPEEVSNDETIYRQLLGYFIKGTPDPGREMLLDQIRRRMLSHADRLFATSLSAHPDAVLSPYRKRYRDGMEITTELLQSVGSMMETLDHENAEEAQTGLERVFFSAWMSDDMDSASLASLNEWLCEESSDVNTASVWLTGLILHGTEKFSPQVWMILADVYERDRHQLWQRALIGMLLMLLRYDERMDLYPGITKRLSVMAEDELFRQRFIKAAIQLIRTGDTEKISKRVQEEIMPEMMKLAPRIREKLSLDQFLQDDAIEDKNPEWEKFFEESPAIYQKLEELNRMQAEGADLFVNTFAQLKHFPFFRSVTNWFLPFIPHHPMFREEERIDTGPAIMDFLEVFGKYPVMCNSDKYSFGFNLLSLPEEQQRMLTSALSGEMGEAGKIMEDEALTHASGGEEVFHQFSQDLYRFFRLHPSKNETVDPFAGTRQLYACSTIRTLLDEYPQITRMLAEYYFQQDHYLHSLHLFELLESAPQDSPELFQKMAYAWQMSGNLDKAVSYYQKAELFDTNALWNLKKIAWCYHLMNDLPAAIRAYREAELLDTSSVQIKLNIGNLLLQQNEWEEALHYYLKAEELKPGDIKTLRPVAWCLFLQGETDTAEYYYEQIMELGYNQNDLLNFGHVRFVQGDRDKALDLYLSSLSHRGQSRENFIEAYRNDSIHLTRLGIQESDQACMLDAILFSPE